MRRIQFQTILLSILLLSSFVAFAPIQDGYATSATYTSITSPATIDFRDIGDTTTVDNVPDPIISLDKASYRSGETATVSVTDANADVTATIADFAFATVDASSLTLTETAISSGVFTGTFTVGSDPPSVDYSPDSKSAARAQIVLPSGFSGDLTISDATISDSEANGACIYPVTGAVSITGTLNVEPTIYLSYANANFTGIVAGNDKTTIGMYYKAAGQQYELITPAWITEAGYVDVITNTIKSKNTLDGSIHDQGGWDTNPTVSSVTPTTEFSGEYVLAVDSGCAGGGGGGLVSPGLVVNALAGIGGAGGGGGSPSTSLGNLISSPVIDVPEEVEIMVLNHDNYAPIAPMDPDSFEGFDFPLTIDDQGFVLGGFSNTLQTQTIKTDTPVTMKFTVYTDDKVQHFSMYANLRGADDSIPDSNAQILYNDGKDLKIIDPEGFFSDAKITVTEEDEDSIKKYITVEMTFAKEMDTSHIITRMWDSHLRSGDTHILDAIKVESAIPEFNPVPQVTEEIQVEELTIGRRANDRNYSKVGKK
jgi:hypothetical protein